MQVVTSEENQTVESSRPNLFDFDQGVRNKINKKHIAGVDEVGRGPLAGPVVAACVILRSQVGLDGLNDSKKISAKKRESLFWAILKNAQVGIGVVHEDEIDEINIYQATRVAMRKAVLALGHTPDCLLVDGNMTLDLPVPQKTVVRGDQQSASIAAASVVAKVYRDAWMCHLDEIYPEYGFKSHKGYGTKTHMQGLKEAGPAPIHRRSFSPVAALIKAPDLRASRQPAPPSYIS